MDKFKNRIRYFALGLFLGTVVVYFTFGNRGCAWLPENRAKNEIGEKEIIASDSIVAVMACLDIDNEDIYNLLKDEGEVEFSLSSPRATPKVYYIESYKNEKLYWAKFALFKEKGIAEITEVFHDNGKTCEVNVSSEFYSTIPLPHKDVVAILESNDFRILDTAKCEMEFYQIDEKNLFDFHKTARMDAKGSEPRKLPNPNYMMKGEINGKVYRIKYIIGDNRTRIEHIYGENPTNCADTL